MVCMPPVSKSESHFTILRISPSVISRALPQIENSVWIVPSQISPRSETQRFLKTSSVNVGLFDRSISSNPLITSGSWPSTSILIKLGTSSGFESKKALPVRTGKLTEEKQYRPLTQFELLRHALHWNPRNLDQFDSTLRLPQFEHYLFCWF